MESYCQRKQLTMGIENISQNMDDYQSSSRTGQKISLKMADMGLSTIINQKDRDSWKNISGQSKRSFHRLRIWDRNSRSAVTSQSYVKAFTFLDGIRSKLALPEHVSEKSAYIFRKAEQKENATWKIKPVHYVCSCLYGMQDDRHA